jgi:protein deglycase
MSGRPAPPCLSEDRVVRALIPVANGVEDIEAVTIIDVLRRAGVEVTVASIEPDLTVTCARGCRLTADAAFSEAVHRDYDLIVCPGGSAGAEAQGRHAPLIQKLRNQQEHGKAYAAICAAPALVLAANGLLDGRRATCYPSFRDRLPNPSDERVVVDGNCVTSQSPATAMAFALTLVELLCGKERARQVGEGLLFRDR